jgi:hypothetical protein
MYIFFLNTYQPDTRYYANPNICLYLAVRSLYLADLLIYLFNTANLSIRPSTCLAYIIILGTRSQYKLCFMVFLWFTFMMTWFSLQSSRLVYQEPGIFNSVFYILISNSDILSSNHTVTHLVLLPLCYGHSDRRLIHIQTHGSWLAQKHNAWIMKYVTTGLIRTIQLDFRNTLTHISTCWHISYMYNCAIWFSAQ